MSYYNDIVNKAKDISDVNATVLSYDPKINTVEKLPNEQQKVLVNRYLMSTLLKSSSTADVDTLTYGAFLDNTIRDDLWINGITDVVIPYMCNNNLFIINTLTSNPDIITNLTNDQTNNQTNEKVDK